MKEVLRDFPARCKGIAFTESHDIPNNCLHLNITAYRFSPALFRKIDFFGTSSPILIVEVPPFPQWADSNWASGCTVFIPFQDPANVGACIRASAAFGASRVVILKDAAHPYHPKSLRAAGSSVLRVDILEGPFLRELIIENGPCVTLSPEGKDITTYKFPDSFALIPGLEGPGLPFHLRDGHVLSIPMEPGVESLNAAMATGIALFLWKISKVGKSKFL